MPDVSRSDSQRSDSSQRPRVSFNRDVRIKRIGRPEGSVVTAVTSDGEGNLVPTAVRRERGQSSRSQSAREAALVLKHADSVNCIPVLDTTQRKAIIPKRSTKDIENQNNMSNKPRRRITRSVSDAGGRNDYDRNKYIGDDFVRGKTYWSENEGEEDSASSGGGRQKLRKQEEKKINIFATLNNRFRGKKKKKNIDFERSELKDSQNTPTNVKRKGEIGVDGANRSHLKTEKSKSKSIENLPEVGVHQNKPPVTQTSTLPRRSKNSKKQLSPIIEDEPITINPRRSPFDFTHQNRSPKSTVKNEKQYGDFKSSNSAPKIVIEPPTPIHEVGEKMFTQMEGQGDQESAREYKIPSDFVDSGGRDSRSSLRMVEGDDAGKTVDKDDKAKIKVERDYWNTRKERDNGKGAIGKVNDSNSKPVKKSRKNHQNKPEEFTKSRSKFYDNEDWLSSEEEFGLVHDNGHYKSYDYGLLDPDLSLTNINEEHDVIKNKESQLEGISDERFSGAKTKRNEREGGEKEKIVPKTHEKDDRGRLKGNQDSSTSRGKESGGKKRIKANNIRVEGQGEDRLMRFKNDNIGTNLRKDEFKHSIPESSSHDRGYFLEENSRADVELLQNNSREGSAREELKKFDEDLFKSEMKSRGESKKTQRSKEGLSKTSFRNARRGSYLEENLKFDSSGDRMEMNESRKLMTSDEEESMSRKTVGMLVEELSRKQSAQKSEAGFQADKSKKLSPLIDPLLDVDRSHNNNRPFSYTDPYKSPPPLLASVSVDAKQLATPTDEVIYAEVICTPAGKVGGNVGVGGNSSFLARAGHPSTHEAGLAATYQDDETEFGISREPSAELTTSVLPHNALAHKVRKPSEKTQGGRLRSQKTTVHTVVKRAATNAPSARVSSIKINENVDFHGSENPTCSYLVDNEFIDDSIVNRNIQSTKQGSTVELKRSTADNKTNFYNHYTLPNKSKNDSNLKNSSRKETDSGRTSNFDIEHTLNISNTDLKTKYANDSNQTRIEKVTSKKDISSRDSSDALGLDIVANNLNSSKNVITEKEYFIDDYSFPPILEETRRINSETYSLPSSPSSYLSKSERDLSKFDSLNLNSSSVFREEEGIGKRESIIKVDVEREEIDPQLQDSYTSKSSKMNLNSSQSLNVSTEKLLSGDINDLSLRRHRLESIIDSHKRRFESRAISPNRYPRTLTRSISNVSPSYRNTNSSRYIDDDLSSATKKTIKEDRYFERHIKRTASNFKDKDLLSDGVPLKIEMDDSFKTNRNARNNYKTYNYYLKNNKGNEKFNNEYNLTNSIMDNKYKSSDNVAEVYRNEEVNNEDTGVKQSENNGAKYGKKHFREWYTSTSVKKTERGSGDDASYGYGSLKDDVEVDRIKDEGRNIKITKSDGKYPSVKDTDSNRSAVDDIKDNRKSDSGRNSRGGFFEKLRNEQKSSSKSSSSKDPNTRKVSSLEKVRRKLSSWNSGKKNSSQDKAEKKDKKKKGKDQVQEPSREDQKDPLTSRYSEYRGEDSAEDDGGRSYADHMARESDYYATRQRVSTPDTDPTWFRSLDRIKHKTSPSHSSRLSGEDTVDRKHRPVSRANSTSQKNLRFFGESDSGSYPSLTTSHLQVPTNRTSSRLRSSLDSSAESTLEDDSGHSQKSVVYLHAATVGDIPGSRKLHRSQITAGRRSMSREELSSNKTDSTFVPHKRTLSRSISVLAPWRPRHPREGIEVNYNDAGKPPRAPIKINNRTLTRLQQQESKKRPLSSAGDNSHDLRTDRRGSDESRSTNASDLSTGDLRRRREGGGSETDLARSKSVPRSSKLSSGWFRGK